TVHQAPRGRRGEGTGLVEKVWTDASRRSQITLNTVPIPRLSPKRLPAQSLPSRGWVVVWEGEILPSFTEELKLHLVSNQPVKLEIGGNVIGQSTKWMKDRSLSHQMVASDDRPVPVRITVTHDSGPADVSLEWESARLGRTLVPMRQLRSPIGGGAGSGLKVEVLEGEHLLPSEGGSLRLPVQAASPYGEVTAWTEVSGPGIPPQRVTPGDSVDFPRNETRLIQRYVLRTVVIDPAGRSLSAETAEVLVMPPVYVPAPKAQPDGWSPEAPATRASTGEAARALAVRNENRRIYEPLAREAAERYGLDPAIFCRMIEVESSWNPRAVSWVGAMGLGQLMPGTASDLGVSDPFDPIENLDGAARYLAAQLKRFGTYRLALAAYNAGPGAVRRFRGVPPYRETQRYVRKILDN
ncbi:MAG: transglycosylase SLT domain-containing protein, partial [Fimbriimonadaceae bacterium]|nr:transglycosylase SLT domain-containing protein [Fimbriimonadaceae bacterium]